MFIEQRNVFVIEIFRFSLCDGDKRHFLNITKKRFTTKLA